MLSTIVDEVDGMLGVGPEIFEDLEDFVKTGKQPFDHVYETFLCMSYSTILLLQRNHDEVITTLMVCHRTSSLILALCMTLPSYEGYAGGSR